jgi:hypothetical protein
MKMNHKQMLAELIEIRQRVERLIEAMTTTDEDRSLRRRLDGREPTMIKSMRYYDMPTLDAEELVQRWGIDVSEADEGEAPAWFGKYGPTPPE